jgi:hypothetical protein
MGQALAKSMRSGRRSDLPQKDHVSGAQRKALWTLRKEARAAGSFLSSGGKGGLDSTLVLGVMRRDKYRCKACGDLGNKDNGGLGVHHKSEHLESPKAKRRSKLLGKEHEIDSRANVVSICKRCHDEVHKEDREDFGDAEQRKHPERH